MIGYDPDFDYRYDPQQVTPVGFCVFCGKELYSLRSEACDRCLFDMEVDMDD